MIIMKQTDMVDTNRKKNLAIKKMSNPTIIKIKYPIFRGCHDNALAFITHHTYDVATRNGSEMKILGMRNFYSVVTNVDFSFIKHHTRLNRYFYYIYALL